MLIVEDDAFYAQFISELMQDRQITVTSVRSAEEALREDIQAYDGAIVDVMLPNDPELSGITPEESRGGFSTGICVARRFLKHKTNLPVVLLTSDVTGGDAEAWALKHSLPFVRKDDGSAALLRALDRLGLGGVETTPLAFIVHGHDETGLMQLKDYIQNTLKWQQPIVLREQPNAGKTIIEKFEDHAFGVDCVFVLITPDDTAIATGRGTNDEKRRSRQNVIFEMGFFYGSLGRRSGRVLVLHKGPVELPSDIAGIVWIDITNGIKAAGEDIRNEIRALLPRE
jgi:CheY-like chemotaxis protein